MNRLKMIARITLLPVFGIILSAAGGCGGGTPVYTEAEKEQAVNQANARTAAYGKSAIPGGSAKAGNQNKQGGARR